MSTTVKERLRADLTAAMKARDDLRKGTLRMVLAAITTEEVSGTAARELSDAEVMTVLARELKKRKESAEAFDGGGRAELAQRERAESEVIAGYLPTPLTDDELAAAVDAALAEVADTVGGAATMKQMGQVIKATQARTAGRADGRRISDAVKAALSR
ncbi:GatB/YqeY domain-containing protein [Nakamurella deserti]|uniref:GatB/YqeY domain-containing protein n=1 Tax=Nakamurella deserti TaxID=2164074 RepID=UPI000DBE963D|nr:GatB/YqeY domain-containing protein [Nakamurella deserti]